MHAVPDALGINIYTAHAVRAVDGGFEFAGRWPGFPRTAIGWPVEPDSLDWGPYFIAERYGLPLCFDVSTQNLDLPVGIILVLVVLGREITGQHMLSRLFRRRR